jgi:hypothetical protein
MPTIEWIPSALNELADLWLKGSPPERQAISRATQEIDSLLRVDPDNSGESRSEGRRILLDAPLGVIFKHESLDRKVRVLKVWGYKTRLSEE